MRWRRLGAALLWLVAAGAVSPSASAKSRWTAGLLSLCVPGAGQFYNDQPGRGTAMLAAYFLASALGRAGEVEERMEREEKKGFTGGERKQVVRRRRKVTKAQRFWSRLAEGIRIYSALDAFFNAPEEPESGRLRCRRPRVVLGFALRF